MKAIKITEIMYFGRGYRYQYNSDLHYWWYNVDEQAVQWANDIVQRLSEGKQLQKYIKVFAVDIIELEKEFLIEMNAKEVLETIYRIDSDFDRGFRIYQNDHFGIWDDLWWAYERNRLVSEAIEWCKKNHIAYEIDVEIIKIDKEKRTL